MKHVYIYVLASNFSDYRKEEQNGGAIHLINCGIHCNDTNFIDCVSSYGAGGGIYINSTLSLTNNATFENVLFLRCKVSYGGGAFIYAKSDLFNISFDSCHFESNEALTKKKQNNGQNEHFYGGSSMYIMSKKSTISNSSFVLNKGTGTVKIYNDFEDKSSLLQKNENSIFIISCKFDEDENSKGSINFLDEKSRINLDIVD